MGYVVPLGLLALCMVIIALGGLRKWPHISALLGAGAIVSMCFSAKDWHYALWTSGKKTAWLGFNRYPIALILTVLIIGAGLYCAVRGSMLYLRERKG